MTMYEFMKICYRKQKNNPYLRIGQIMFNEFHNIFPDEANFIRGTDKDPFHSYEFCSDNIVKFMEYAEEVFSKNN